MKSNAAELYQRIQDDKALSQKLFRQALQDPQGALKSISDYGEAIGLPVQPSEVKEFLETLDDNQTKQWVVKARGGL